MFAPPAPQNQRLPPELADPTDRVAVDLRPGTVLTGLLAIAVLLTAAHLAVAVMVFHYGRSWTTLFEQVNLNNESTVGTWFSSGVLAFDAVLLWWLGRSRLATTARTRTRFTVLAVLVLMASVDEVATFHEHVSDLLHRHFHTDGVLLYAWVVPALVGVLVVATWTVPALLRLPGSSGKFLVAAAGLYVAAAVGTELIDSYWDSHAWMRGTVFYAVIALEEFGEMLGACLAAYALLCLLAISRSTLQLCTSHSRPQQSLRAHAERPEHA